MRFSFTFEDCREIYSSACVAFVSTFKYLADEDESDSDPVVEAPDSDSKITVDVSDSDSDSDLPDFDPAIYGCGEITPEIENMVDDSWEFCEPLKEVYGKSSSDIIKDTVKTATEETQCAGLKFFKETTPGEDRNLIETCTTVVYWCCCESVKKVSPIIADATTNLMY